MAAASRHAQQCLPDKAVARCMQVLCNLEGVRAQAASAAMELRTNMRLEAQANHMFQVMLLCTTAVIIYKVSNARFHPMSGVTL
jgi:hypothetical protein